jgi:pilus assembly protein Flp/PilA
MLMTVKNFLKQDEGASLVEYGLLVGLIAVVCIGAIALLGTSIKGMFTEVGTEVEAAADAAGG